MISMQPVERLRTRLAAWELLRVLGLVGSHGLGPLAAAGLVLVRALLVAAGSSVESELAERRELAEHNSAVVAEVVGGMTVIVVAAVGMVVDDTIAVDSIAGVVAAGKIVVGSIAGAVISGRIAVGSIAASVAVGRPVGYSRKIVAAAAAGSIVGCIHRIVAAAVAGSIVVRILRRNRNHCFRIHCFHTNFHILHNQTIADRSHHRIHKKRNRIHYRTRCFHSIVVVVVDSIADCSCRTVVGAAGTIDAGCSHRIAVVVAAAGMIAADSTVDVVAAGTIVAGYSRRIAAVEAAGSTVGAVVVGTTAAGIVAAAEGANRTGRSRTAAAGLAASSFAVVVEAANSFVVGPAVHMTVAGLVVVVAEP